MSQRDRPVDRDRHNEHLCFKHSLITQKIMGSVFAIGVIFQSI